MNDETLLLLDRPALTTWHWIICFTVPLAIYVEAALPHSFGTFIAEFRREKPNSLQELDWLSTVTAVIPCLLLPITVPLLQNKSRKSYRLVSAVSFTILALGYIASSFVNNLHLLFFTFSFFSGLSITAILSVCTAVLSEWFPRSQKYHILATSLFQLGYPLASLTFNPTSADLIRKFGWKNVFRVHALIALVAGLCVSCCLKTYSSEEISTTETPPVLNMQSSPAEKLVSQTDRDNGYGPTEEDRSLKSCKSLMSGMWPCTMEDILNRPQIFPWLLAKLLNYGCWFAIRTNLVFMIHSQNETRLVESSIIMVTYAGGEILMCVLCSIISMFLKGRLLVFNIAANAGVLVIIIAWLLLISNDNLAGMLIIGFLLGLTVQATLYYGFPTSAEVLELDLAFSWVLTMVASGFGMLLSPIIGGMLIVMDKDFKVFLFTQASLWLGQLLLLGLALCMKRNQKHLGLIGKQ